ncbi:ABC transporter permease [Peribacillus simplex]|uniref:ABC transporter permease n=1 Tax=Peribacillus simplex TaxID=1478 RepID=A0A9X8ZDN7_9BACI|nr:ABC transporter permease [Peribacillus simplex]TKH07734.1 ABC transporter permease [Peribacillus simplex]
MVKLMELEWRKLRQKMILSELIIYWGILMFLPLFFIKVVSAEFGQSYSTIIQLMMSMQLGFVLFGASLINQVVIDEYKNKTISLSFGYPISRKKLVMAKALFISLFVFLCTLVSFLLSGMTTYLLDQAFHIINGQPTAEDITTYFSKMIVHSLIVTLISLIPLFFFGIWKRETIPTVLCAIFLMQFQNFSFLLNVNLNTNIVNTVLCLLGVVSVYLSIKMVDSVGDI